MTEQAKVLLELFFLVGPLLFPCGDQSFLSTYDYRHPKSGSFVRPKKVDFGISIIDALKEQYGVGGDGINPADMYVISGKNKKKPVEMVGADSIQEKQRYSLLFVEDRLCVSCGKSTIVSFSRPGKLQSLCESQEMNGEVMENDFLGTIQRGRACLNNHFQVPLKPI